MPCNLHKLYDFVSFKASSERRRSDIPQCKLHDLRLWLVVALNCIVRQDLLAHEVPRLLLQALGLDAVILQDLEHIPPHLQTNRQTHMVRLHLTKYETI